MKEKHRDSVFMLLFWKCGNQVLMTCWMLDRTHAGRCQVRSIPKIGYTV